MYCRDSVESNGCVGVRKGGHSYLTDFAYTDGATRGNDVGQGGQVGMERPSGERSAVGLSAEFTFETDEEAYAVLVC